MVRYRIANYNDTTVFILDNLGQNMAASAHFYPYGSGVGDSICVKKYAGLTGTIPMSTSFVLYGTYFNNIWVRTFA